MGWRSGPVKPGVEQALRELLEQGHCSVCYYAVRVFGLVILASAAIGLLVGCAATPKSRTRETPPSVASTDATHVAASDRQRAPQRKFFKLAAENFWRIELPDGQRTDASGLVRVDGKLLMVADGNPTLYELELGEANTATLKTSQIFARSQLMPFLADKRGRFDFEGLARDEAGRIYACEEGNRWIFRFDPATREVERLDVDWSPVQKYFSADENASFEGIAVGGGKMWLANERERARVIEVDLDTLNVIGDFAPEASFWALVTHYSDLCWFEGRLFLLLRHHRVVLEIDPSTRDVLAEYNYAEMEEVPEHRYLRAYPTGTMEGLMVDKEYFWLLTDNNGFVRQQDSRDRRPTLFRCRRPR